MNFSRWVFRVAGVYGLLVLVPQYFMEQQFGRDYPPPITHPEFFYGFLGVAIAWQVAFLIIAHDPLRFRPLMIPSALEKITFGVAAAILFWLQRVPGMIFAAGLVDLAFAVLFLIAWRSLGANGVGSRFQQPV